MHAWPEVPGQHSREPPAAPGRQRSQAAVPPCGGLSSPKRLPGAKAVATTITHEMAAAPLPVLVLYGRPECGLCDEARDLLRALLDERARRGLPIPAMTEIDIESDADLEHRYFATIPVVELGDRRLELATSAAKLRRLLSDVLVGSAATTPA